MKRSDRVPNPYALLVRRFLGFMLDAVIVATLAIVVGNAIASTTPSGESLSSSTLLAVWVAVIGLWVGYWTILVGGFRATVGQRVARVRVVADGEPIGFARQLIRCAIAPFAFAPLALGYIFAILDWSYRSVVDIVSRTRVIAISQLGAAAPAPTERYTESPWPSSVAIDRMATVADALAVSAHWWAVGVMRQLVGNITSDPEALAGAAWAFARAGDSFRTFAITKRFLGDDPESPPLALAAHALALARTDAPAAAAEILQRAGRVPDAVRSHVEIEIALAADDLQSADTEVRAFTHDFPDSLDAWLLAGRVARRQNDAEAMRRSAEESVRIAPNNADARDAAAVALGPHAGLVHPPASSAELSALAAVLDVDPFHPEAQRRLALVTLGQRGIQRGLAVFFGLLGVIRVIVIATGGTVGIVNVILTLVFLILAVVLASRFVVLRARLNTHSRPWVRYLEALSRGMIDRRTGRAPAPLADIAPVDSVLGSPGRCWCATLQHTRGVSALEYTHAHLLEAEPSPAAGVYLFRCPEGRGAYVGIDGRLVDAGLPFTELYRVEPRDLAAADPDVPIGMYL